ncbi:hypothetical protein Tco_0128256 [Tanacetum coccineum]
MKNQRTTLWWFKTTRTLCGADTNQPHPVGLDCSGGSGVEIGGGCGVRGHGDEVEMDEWLRVASAGGRNLAGTAPDNEEKGKRPWFYDK